MHKERRYSLNSVNAKVYKYSNDFLEGDLVKISSLNGEDIEIKLRIF